MSNLEEEKQIAGEKAVELIKSGNVVGLGTGSTVHYFLIKLAEEIGSGKLNNIVGVATSKETELKALDLGIPLSSLNENPVIDITIDGADEIDGYFNLIKGGGGALLREKIIAQASKQLIIVADSSKYSDQLFANFKLPVEVFKIALESEKKFLVSLGAVPTLRELENGAPYLTDEGNYILDCKFTPGHKPSEIEAKLNYRAGIVCNGLFIKMAGKVIIAHGSNAKLFENSQELLKLKSNKK